jgi:hypothetical protein
MTQADSVPSSSRQLITGERANQSTSPRVANLPAVNLPAVRVKPADGRYFIGDSDARIVMPSNEAPRLRLWRKKRSDEPDDLLKCRCYRAEANQAPVGSNIEALLYANAAFFLGRLLRRIVQILLLFAIRNQRLRNNALDKASSNQLVRLNAKEKLK